MCCVLGRVWVVVGWHPIKGDTLARLELWFEEGSRMRSRHVFFFFFLSNRRFYGYGLYLVYLDPVHQWILPVLPLSFMERRSMCPDLQNFVLSESKACTVGSESRYSYTKVIHDRKL